MTLCMGAGTLPYMAPEVLMGRHNSLHDHITNRVDIYSLAVMMWEMLAGRQPWSGMSEAAVLAAVREVWGLCVCC
jgi:serine/threonine protein kinase